MAWNLIFSTKDRKGSQLLNFLGSYIASTLLIQVIHSEIFILYDFYKTLKKL